MNTQRIAPNQNEDRDVPSPTTPGPTATGPTTPTE